MDPAAAADEFAAFIEEYEHVRLERLRVAELGTVCIVFYRRSEIEEGEERHALTIVLLDEPTPRRWVRLSATDTSQLVSTHHSDRGDWIVAIAGSAPPGASAAVLSLEGVAHRVPVADGVYAFARRSAHYPDDVQLQEFAVRFE